MGLGSLDSKGQTFRAPLDAPEWIARRPWRSVCVAACFASSDALSLELAGRSDGRARIVVIERVLFDVLLGR
jgi:hypothetical protein